MKNKRYIGTRELKNSEYFISIESIEQLLKNHLALNDVKIKQLSPYYYGCCVGYIIKTAPLTKKAKQHIHNINNVKI